MRGRLGVSPAAHVILPYHRAVEAVAEQGPGAIGTTGRGIGFAYRDKAARTGVRIGDLFDPRRVRARGGPQPRAAAPRVPRGAGLDARPRRGRARRSCATPPAWLEPLRRATCRLELHRGAARRQAACCSRARRARCSISTTAPIPTSPRRAASAAGAPLGVGLGPRAVDRVIGVTKAYTTRVGHGPFPSEMPETEAARLREAGEEYGATTGRPRRCGWLDLPALRYAARVNGLDALVVTKLDVLDEFDEIHVVVAYEIDGRAVEGFPADAAALERVPARVAHVPRLADADDSVRDTGAIFRRRRARISSGSSRRRACRS